MMRVWEKPLWDDAHQFVLDLARRPARRDREPVGEAKDMGVDRDGRLAEGGVEHYIGGLSPAPGNASSASRSCGVCTAMLLGDRLREGDHVLRLGSIEPDRFDRWVAP